MKNDSEIISIKNAEHYLWGTNCDGWHLVNTNELSVIQERVPSGASEVKHYHKKARQFFFILQGQAVIEFDTFKKILNPGEGIHIPPNTKHKLVNESEVDLIFLVISQPKSHCDKFLV
jgi:mannose-6-phosphate isomerase-like protein (cupin superfamily)